MRLRGTITSAAVRSRNASAREAISAVGASSAPALPGLVHELLDLLDREARLGEGGAIAEGAQDEVRRRGQEPDERARELRRGARSGARDEERVPLGGAQRNRLRDELAEDEATGTRRARRRARARPAPRTRATAGQRARAYGASRPARAAPPNAAAVAPTTVIPTWTVARNRSGSSRSRFTARADERPSSTSWASRVLRSEMIAISAPAKTPFASTSARMIAISTRISLSRTPPGPA